MSCAVCRRKSVVLRNGLSSRRWRRLPNADIARPAGLRVLHLVPALFGPAGIVGGAERYALELARHMANRLPTRLLTFGLQSEERRIGNLAVRVVGEDRKSTRLNSSHVSISYAVFCLKKKK